MDGSQKVNPFLAGNYAPVHDETDLELAVSGQMPKTLAGALYRNGPNPQFAPRDEHHWFAGDGMIHGFFIEDGAVRYRNRYVRTPKWRLENAAGRALFGTFGNPLTSDPSVLGQDGGVANTNIVWHGGKLMALEEGHMPTALDPVSLETRGYVEGYRGCVTAHPKLDPETGEMVWFAYSSGEGLLNATMSYGVTNAAGEVVRRDDFQAPFSSMVHDFLVTRRHALFPVLPLTGSLERAMRGGPAYAWEPDKGAFVGVMARDADVSQIRWFETDPCYVFHPMNAWEEGTRIFADVMEYPVAPLFPNVDGGRGQDTAARLMRWTIDMAGASNAIKREPLDDLPGEFPRFDERHAGLAYRHGWFAARTGEGSIAGFDAIAHVDLKTGARSIYKPPAGDVPGEPIFVPRSPTAGEGDGYLLSVVYRGAEDVSDLIVLEAADIAAGPIAQARVPRRVPFGFHGNWRGA
ncbi:MAG TPA: carotenoid oxygenase family protein [Caulobacteraceae bacterium]|jgi:carotenoid cleavage dioxygenase|nr:carotenoid oxygenase family protein [Caulobacteraceae bacterium]